ncbi:glucosaminidase domain-containing protein [Cohnella sp.]|uniref:glucosaminidase domain-containing protein n=1 Tax=Cohnella sp. TaxID=1883426 RepID=UPI00356841EA
MRRKYNKQLCIYVLIVALFITFGTSFQKTNTPVAEAAPYPSDTLDFLDQTMSLPRSPVLHAFTDGQAPIVFETAQLVKVNAEVHNASYKPIKVVSQEKEKSNTYEVTAHLLNVRANPSRKSDIINVIKEGDLLEVLQSTDNGWLKIKNGGYVHGGYAKKVHHPIPAREEKYSNPIPTSTKEPGKPTTKVKSESGLTENHISTIFKGTALEDEGLEEVILEIEQEYGINAYFTIAVLKLESGNGKSRLAKNKNNLFGLNAIDGDAHNKAFSFKTKGDSVRKFGQLISKNYVAKGYTTIEKVASKYCPANDDWSSLVSSIMKGDYKKL